MAGYVDLHLALGQVSPAVKELIGPHVWASSCGTKDQKTPELAQWFFGRMGTSKQVQGQRR